MSQLDCDVVIVGAGISGALVAWKLGSLGLKVIVLESGPGNPSLADRQNEDSRRLHFFHSLDTFSAARSTRIAFSPRILWMSSFLYPRSSSAWVMYG